MLETTDELVSVEEWLNDWIVYRDVRIGALIHEVGNKDGAHADAEAGGVMTTLESRLVVSVGGQRQELARPVIEAIARYVAARVRALLAEQEG